MLLNNKSMDMHLLKAREELDMMVRINLQMKEFIRNMSEAQIKEAHKDK
jgi:hypothetical protein